MRRRRLAELHDAFARCPLPGDLGAVVRSELGIDLSARYGGRTLANPLLVAPGQLTVNTGQLARIREAGFAGCVVKSVVAEDAAGVCTMAFQRVKSSFIRTVYDPDDAGGERPIIHWDGRMDTRTLGEYLPFAREARGFDDVSFLVIGSFLGHLPGPGEAFNEQEWRHTLDSLHGVGYRLIEIDFCPSLKKESDLVLRENVLRWYREAPALVKRLRPDVIVYPKLLNLDFGMDFQVRMAGEAAAGGADGVVAANRFFRQDLGCAHGGRSLLERNLLMVREIRRAFPSLPVSATGGVYAGRDVFAYIRAGAENVQLLSYLMGKVGRRFAKEGHKFAQVFHRLVFDPADGLLAAMLEAGA